MSTSSASPATVGLLPDDDAQIKSVLLDRPVTSLTDIAYLYGSLDALYLARRLEEAEIDAPAGMPGWVVDKIDPRYLLAMTPDHDPTLFDTADTLCNINVVLDPPIGSDHPSNHDSNAESESEPRLHDDIVTFEQLSPTRMLEIGYCYRPNKTVSFDHSIGTLVNGKKGEKTKRYAESRLRGWPTGVAQDVAEAHDTGWIIEQLAQLGENDEIVDRVVEAVRNGIEGVAGGEDRKHTCVLSVAFWIADPTSISTPRTDQADKNDELIGPIYPGLLPICNDVSLARLRKQIGGFGSGIDDSSGVAADFVTSIHGEVFGTSPGRPLDYYHAQQYGEFPDFDGEQSWQSYPLGYDTALAVRRGTDLIADCRERLGYGYYAYLLPYTPEMDVYAARDIYAMVHGASRGKQTADGRDTTLIATALAEKIGTNWVQNLRYYQILINTELDEKVKVVAERPTCTLMPVAELDSAHLGVLYEVANTSSGTSGSMLDRTVSQVSSILSGWYFTETMYDPDRHKKKNTPMSANDERIMLSASVLAGDPINADFLVRSYVTRLIQDQRDMLSDSDIDAEVPSRTAFKQYIQFNALTRAGLIERSTMGPFLPVRHVESADQPEHTTLLMTTDASTDQEPTSREARLEQHIRNHDELSDNPTYCAAYLLGALVARVAAQQYSDGVRSTVARRYPIDSVSRRDFASVFAGVQKTAEDYDQKHNRTGTNDRFVVRIDDTVSSMLPTEWAIQDDVLRMAYGLGLSYGRRDYYIDPDKNDEE